MEQNLMTLQYSGKTVRTVMNDGAPWWVLVDVCAVLGITNNRNVSARLDDDEKGVCLMDTPGGKQEMKIINESGLYSVLLRSDKPEAKPFKRWVTHEVLPSIRKNGGYTVSKGKLVCDVPGNAAACQIMQEMTKSATAIQVLVDGYKRYFWSEQERAGYAEAIMSICQRLYMKSDELARLKYNMVEKNW